MNPNIQDTDIQILYQTHIKSTTLIDQKHEKHSLEVKLVGINLVEQRLVGIRTNAQNQIYRHHKKNTKTNHKYPKKHIPVPKNHKPRSNPQAKPNQEHTDIHMHPDKNQIYKHHKAKHKN